MRGRGSPVLRHTMAEHAYTDEELSDKIMAYIYETGGCDDIGVTMQERYGIKLKPDEVHRIRRRLVSMGYVSEDSYAYGNHPHLSITDEGIRYREDRNSRMKTDTVLNSGLRSFIKKYWRWLIEITVAAVAALAAVASC